MLILLLFLTFVTSEIALLPSQTLGSIRAKNIEDIHEPLMMEPVARIPSNASAPFNPSFSLRLDPILNPLEYLVKIFPIRAKNETFRGFVEIDFKVLKKSSVVYLNLAMIDLHIGTLQIKRRTRWGVEEEVELMDHFLYPEKEVVAFTLKTNLSVGDFVNLSVFYTGHLVHMTKGLNQITYIDQNGNRTRAFSTYFQPNGARRVFPCLDEPDLKSRFTLHVAKHIGESVLSNMPVKRVYPDKDASFNWTEFKKTLPMSTYLVAFVISDFKRVTSSYTGVTRVWSRKKNLKNRVFASKLAGRVLDWYERYFEVKFPLPKLDLVTFPSYAVAGMENFGLIVTQEKSLTTNGQLSRKEWVATVTAHEIAHQWAGNLATPKWWSEYWLSEGFATYFAAMALDELEPELESTKRMLSDQVQFVLHLDDGDFGSALVIDDFDPIVSQSKNLQIYYKGASMLRLLSSIFGEQVFSKSIKRFFQANQFKSVTEGDLYSTLTEMQKVERATAHNRTLPVPLEEIMNTWTTQKGYPKLYVSRMPTGQISVQQGLGGKNTTFSSPASEGRNYTMDYPYWWVPISYTTLTDSEYFSSYTYPRAWLPPTPKPLVLEGTTSKDMWAIVNVKQTLYSRVNYDPSLWKAISEQLLQNHLRFHSVNRALLFHDAFFFFDKGQATVDVPLSLLRYLRKEQSFSPLESAFKRLNNIETIMRGTAHYGLLKRFLEPLVTGLLEGRFGKGSHMDNKSYDLILSWSCKLRTSECYQLSPWYFSKWNSTKDLNSLPELSSHEVLCVAVERSLEKWEVMFDWFFNTSDSEERESLSKVLACAPHQQAATRFLEAAKNSTPKLKFDELRNVFENFARSLRWGKFMWNFIIDNYNDFVQRFEDVPLPFVTTDYDLQQFQVLLGTHLQDLQETNREVLEMFQKENEELARTNTELAFRVSNWLIRKQEEENLRRRS